MNLEEKTSENSFSKRRDKDLPSHTNKITVGKKKKQEMPMGTVGLKTMTERVRINFGEYRNKEVKYLLTTDCHVLREMYYEEANRSFVPYILDALGITEEYRIKKSGTDKKMFAKLKKDRNGKLPFRLFEEEIESIVAKTNQMIEEIKSSSQNKPKTN